MNAKSIRFDDSIAKLNLRQQRIVSEVIDRARKLPGLHTAIPHRDATWMYAAEQLGSGTLRWWIIDIKGRTALSRECS